MTLVRLKGLSDNSTGSLQRPAIYTSVHQTSRLPRWQSIAQSTTRQHLDQQSYSWQHLGYLHLKLLNQTDIKNMTKLWGEPGQHLAPLLPGAAKSFMLDLRTLEMTCYELASKCLKHHRSLGREPADAPANDVSFS